MPNLDDWLNFVAVKIVTTRPEPPFQNIFNCSLHRLPAYYSFEIPTGGHWPELGLAKDFEPTEEKRYSPMARKDFLIRMQDVLIQRRDALRKAINGDDSLLKELSQKSGGDVVDFASDSAFGELSSQLAEVETRELIKVEEALERIKEGQYGKCEGCSRNIPQARIQALPFVAHCINCKRAAEIAGVEPAAVVDWAAVLDFNDNLDVHIS